MKAIEAIIVAAGEGSRFGGPKQFASLKGKAVVDWSLETFDSHPQVAAMTLVVKDEVAIKRYAGRFQKLKAVVKGGQKRQDSVWAGLTRIDPEVTDVVL
ncbi:MAG: 2-C-methyl-D-erythritol 4-phosphate cytidylyltransferase, partial [Candidatus Aminicenantales bacterium]